MRCELFQVKKTHLLIYNSRAESTPRRGTKCPMVRWDSNQQPQLAVEYFEGCTASRVGSSRREWSDAAPVISSILLRVMFVQRKVVMTASGTVALTVLWLGLPVYGNTVFHWSACPVTPWSMTAIGSTFTCWKEVFMTLL